MSNVEEIVERILNERDVLKDVDDVKEGDGVVIEESDVSDIFGTLDMFGYQRN